MMGFAVPHSSATPSKGHNTLVHSVAGMLAGMRKPGTPALPLGTGGSADARCKQFGADGPKKQANGSTQDTAHSSSTQPQKQSGEAVASAPDAEGSPAEAAKPSDEKLDAARSAMRQKSGQQAHHEQKSRSLWGYVTDYIIGADKLIQ